MQDNSECAMVLKPVQIFREHKLHLCVFCFSFIRKQFLRDLLCCHLLGNEHNFGTFSSQYPPETPPPPEYSTEFDTGLVAKIAEGTLEQKVFRQ